MPEPINLSPMYMVPGELEKRMQMARIAGKPLEHTPRAIEDITGNRSLCERDLCEHDLLDSSGEPFMRMGRTAVISIDAPIYFAASFYAWISGGMTNPMIVRAFNAARDDESIDRIVTDLHCPGGDVAGMSNLIHAIDKAAAVKPVIAMVQDMAASAAYWMASRCHRIVATPTAMIGSIGAISVYYDDSVKAEKEGERAVVITDATHKSLGNFGVPIDEQMIEREMKLVGDMSEKFRIAVSEKRPITVDELKAMGGSMHFADDALARKLCDEITDTADFYEAVEAGAYDQYGPMKSEKNTGGTPVPPKKNVNTTSGQSSTQTRIGVAAMANQEIDDKIAAMTDEEKDQELARLLGDEDETTASTEEEEETTASTASTQEEEEEEETTASAGSTASTASSNEDGKDDKPSASMSIAEIKSVIADAGLPKSIASEMALEAVEKGYSEITLYRKCMKTINSQNARETAQLEKDAATGDPVGGGSGNHAGKTTGGAEALITAEAEKLCTQQPSMTMAAARARVLRENDQLRDQLVAESNA